jgi:uncharacterized membrane protein
LTFTTLSEDDAWRITTLVMLILSASVFIVQRFVVPFLDPVFEVSIFHIPALVAAIIYAKRVTSRAGSPIKSK